MKKNKHIKEWSAFSAEMAAIFTFIGSIIYLTWFVADLNKKIEISDAIQQEQIKQLTEKVDKIYAMLPYGVSHEDKPKGN
jgi:outer membrane receptor for ferrienterochelin and colicin